MIGPTESIEDSSKVEKSLFVKIRMFEQDLGIHFIGLIFFSNEHICTPVQNCTCGIQENKSLSAPLRNFYLLNEWVKFFIGMLYLGISLALKNGCT